MRPHRPWNALLLGLLACAGLTAQAPPLPVAAPLDWSAPHRWVHVDTVGRDGVALFEGARLRWLKALSAGAAPLPDGRPLFWSGDHDGVRTYLTFSPFGEMAELDARGRLVSETQAKLGEQAVKDYDSGDAALVPPHYTQIWRRQPDDDFVSPVAGELTELSASHARLQLLQLDLQAEGRVDDNWKEVRELLARQRYPLTCRVLTSRYGLGQTMLLWLAADAESLRRATSLLELLRQAPGEPRGVALAREYSTLWTVQQQLDLVRRDDLSNLPQARSASAAVPDFARDVRPILLQRCTPCHEPGGVMYGRIPFDDPQAVRSHPDGVLRRIKDPAEKATLQAFLSAGATPP